jgi:sulfur transfer protein SufE
MFDRLGLKDALTAQRSNGLFSMINRIQQEARQAA